MDARVRFFEAHAKLKGTRRAQSRRQLTGPWKIDACQSCMYTSSLRVGGGQAASAEARARDGRGQAEVAQEEGRASRTRRTAKRGQAMPGQADECGGGGGGAASRMQTRDAPAGDTQGDVCRPALALFRLLELLQQLEVARHGSRHDETGYELAAVDRHARLQVRERTPHKSAPCSAAPRGLAGCAAGGRRGPPADSAKPETLQCASRCALHYWYKRLAEAKLLSL